MTDGAFPDRLAQLKSRWEADPSSRVFLQLAEEYRHQGRVKEALAVLDRGLREHPGYLSALVAKGRCHLELGEPEAARGVLERVVKQDATQMVANKLLVRAYLDTGEPDKARERLDLYSLLNDSDPEIEELRRRLRAMEQPPQAPPTLDPFPAATPAGPPRRDAAAPPARTAAGGGDIFDLGFAAPAAPARPGGNDLFELDAPAAAPPPVASQPAAAASAAAVAVAEPEEEPEPAGVLFPGLGSRESRSRYLRALAAEGLFAFELIPETPAAEAPVLETAPAAVEEEIAAEVPAPLRSLDDTAPALEEPFAAEPAWAGAEAGVPVFPEMALPAELAPTLEPMAEEAPVFAVEERTPWAAEPVSIFSAEAPAAEVPAAEAAPAAPPPAAAPAATATLGDLYLRQGHLGEAKKIFDEVLRREPDNPAAREGLTQLASRREERRPLEGRDLLAGYEPGEEGGEMEAKARKAFLLNSYLKRLRRGSQRDVS